MRGVWAFKTHQRRHGIGCIGLQSRGRTLTVGIFLTDEQTPHTFKPGRERDTQAATCDAEWTAAQQISRTLQMRNRADDQ